MGGEGPSYFVRPFLNRESGIKLLRSDNSSEEHGDEQCKTNGYFDKSFALRAFLTGVAFKLFAKALFFN